MIHLLDEDFSALNAYIQQAQPSKIFILVDENTHTYCLPTVLGNLETTAPFEILEIEAGEEMKNIESAISLWEILLEYEADRKSLLINLGGGVVTDLGGFVAATYKRGIDYIHIPTTLLAMVDASIGGKNGIDLGTTKNSVGTITFPKGIFIYPKFLNTLPDEQIFSGFAEMLKHGLIADANHWEAITRLEEISAETLLEYIIPSIAIKKQITEADPLEGSIRKVLNFGHTIGHAIESFHLAQGTPILHGFAVAIGVLLEARMAYRVGILPQKHWQEIEQKITTFFPFCREVSYPISELIPYLKNDKKTETAGIGFVALNEIGNASPDWFVQENELYMLIDF